MEQLADTGIGSLPFIINVTILVLTLALPLMALLMLFRAKGIPDLARVLWVLVILGFPVIGPAAFVLSRGIRPGIDAAVPIDPNQSREQHA